MAISVTNFDSILNAALDFYIKGEALLQNIQERPLLRALEAKKKTFPGGKEFISRAVQGAYMADDAAFFKGYSQADTVAYQHPDNLLRAKYPWKEIHAGIVLTLTELKQDGISVVDTLDGSKTAEHSDRELTAITGLLDNKLTDMGESWAMEMNAMLWGDGSQDAKAVPGLTSLITTTPAVGVTGALNRATYSWWRNRALVGADKIAVSAENQSLTRKLRSEIRQLKRYGAKPDLVLAGSWFIDSLELEVQAKGQYTVEGFKNNGKTDIGMADISIRGVGTVQYDPTLDSMGLGAQAFFIDTRPGGVVLMPMDGEDKKSHTPARPYDQYVILRAMTWTGGLVAWQLNGCGRYEATAI